MTLYQRFWEKVDFGNPDECWHWKGSTTRGYGQISISDRLQLAHRVVYERAVGPIPDGLQIDHLCRTRNCVNPDHMEVVTQRENILRGESPSAAAAQKTQCSNGHPFDLLNTYVNPYTGRRSCRECKRASDRRRRQKNRPTEGEPSE